MKNALKTMALAALLAALFVMVGCAQMYLGKTTAHFSTPEGLVGDYVSDKNQENFNVTATVGPDGKIKSIDIRTTATTPEAAISAALQFQIILLQEIKDLTTKLAAAGAGS